MVWWLAPLVAGYVGYKVGETPTGACCCLTAALIGVYYYGCDNHASNRPAIQPTQQVEPEIRHRGIEELQKIIDTDRMKSDTPKTNLNLENVIGSSADIKRPQKSERYTKPPPAEVKIENIDGRLVKRPEGLERKVYSQKHKSERQTVRGNPNDVVSEDFVAGKEEYLKSNMGSLVYDSYTAGAINSDIVVGEALLFTRDSNDGEKVKEARRFYSKSDKRYLKILGFAKNDAQLEVYLEDKNWYFSDDSGKTWNPKRRAENPAVQRSRIQSYLIERIENYQQNISLRLKQKLRVARICRFEPSCSEYAKQAIEKYGSFRGSVLAVGRLSRCNPWSKGGYDPVT